MLNALDLPSGPVPSIIDYVDPQVAHTMAEGKMNTAAERLHANIAASIRRGHPQMRTGPVQGQRVCLVGSGPSLAETEDELRQLLWDGAILVTLNGAYHWCRERNLKPQTQIVMDARPSNARFVTPYVPKCNYVLASQCAPEVWDTVASYRDVWIWHAVVKAEGATATMLDAYYGGNWVGIGGGTSVATRAINLLRVAGYVRFSLFGVDCCWLPEWRLVNVKGDYMRHGGTGYVLTYPTKGKAEEAAVYAANDYGIEGFTPVQVDVHHAIPQPENAHEKPTQVELSVRGQTEKMTFTVSPWHVKQLEDALTICHVNGKHFQLDVHGSGLLANALRLLGSDSLDALSVSQKE